MHKENGHKIKIRNFTSWYGDNEALTDISMDIPDNSVTSIIGPSGCGKSTLVRCINRINDEVSSFRAEGDIIIDGEDIYNSDLGKKDLIQLRRKVGMVFQKPNPFPFSIYRNIVFGCERAGIKERDVLDKLVALSLKRSALMEEVGEKLQENAKNLSGGQQQRLCIARTIAMQPEVILMDEPCSALDPIATRKIEKLIKELKKDYTVVIVTHNMEQAERVSDNTAFLYLGKLIEYGKTKELFDDPKQELTKKYISGRFG